MVLPLLLVVIWLVSMWLLGWLMLPVSRRIFSNLPDGGLAAGRTLALVLVSLLAFWLASLSVAPLSLAPFFFVVLPLFAFVGPLRRTESRREFFQWARDNQRSLLFSDLLFIGVFIFFVWVRARQGARSDVEKPMDSAIMAMTSRASFLPAAHPWFGGATFTNYYYFFHLIGGLLMRSLGTPPAYGYNLVYALFCALFVSPLWSLCAALTRSMKYGLVAAVVVALLGHFEPLRQLFIQHSWPLSWWSTSRVIQDTTKEITADTINEYPAFTTLIGDAHGHFFALAIATLFFCLCFALFIPASGSTRLGRVSHRSLVLILLGLLIGALVMGNTWDAPTYGLLAVVCGFLTVGEKKWRSVSGLMPLLPLMIAPIVALPYLHLYKSQISGAALEWWSPAGGSFMLFWGGFLALWLLAIWGRDKFKPFFLIVAVVVWGCCLVYPPVGIIGLLIVSIERLWQARNGSTAARSSTPDTAFIAALALLGAIALFAPMFFYIRGYFGDGPNRHQDTVFKFFLQAWLLLGTAAICGAINVWRELPARRLLVRNVFLAVWSVPLLCSLTVLWARTVADAPREGDHYVHPSLDGAQHLPEGDRKAIEWLRQHSDEKDIVLEAVGRTAQNTMGGDYSVAGRVSAISGVAAALGWPDHVRMWGVDYGEIIKRWDVVRRIYSWPNNAEALNLLKQLNVRYVYVGGLEREYYDAAALARLDSALQVVYDEDGVRIYETPR